MDFTTAYVFWDLIFNSSWFQNNTESHFVQLRHKNNRIKTNETNFRVKEKTNVFDVPTKRNVENQTILKNECKNFSELKCAFDVF
jgi:hypothetical protein